MPVRETIWPVAGDNTANIQAAIDKVSSRPLDAGRLPRRRAAQGGLLPNGDAGEDSSQRRGVARRRAWATPAPILIGTGTGRTGGWRSRRWRRQSGHPGSGRRCVRRDDKGRHETDRHRRLCAGRCAQLQSGIRTGFQARRYGDRAAHRQSGLDRCRRHERARPRRAAGVRSTSIGIASSWTFRETRSRSTRRSPAPSRSVGAAAKC